MKPSIKEVCTRKELRQFVHYPNALYKDNPYYVPTLEKGDLASLDPEKNHAFEFCEGKYWLAYDPEGKIVGRIAGIINRRYNEKTGVDYARFGFMDFVDDNEVVDALFDTVEAWAREKGMKVINGPLGLTLLAYWWPVSTNCLPPTANTISPTTSRSCCEGDSAKIRIGWNTVLRCRTTSRNGLAVRPV